MSPRRLAALSLLVVVLAACSGSKGSDGLATPPVASADAYTRSLAAGLAAKGGNFELSKAGAACTAKAWVRDIGPRHLAASELRPEDLEAQDLVLGRLDLPPEQAGRVVAALERCVPDAFATFRTGMAAGQEADARACFTKALDDGFVRQLLVASLQGDEVPEALRGRLATASRSCGIPYAG
ncbi:hypothetical protein KSP35_16450 [Aquihabitans sp. G128]|uniref:hypothetical protein n=1 Tax=Aquihabitans sp. G128 TaxID=2849779 RepID=UPI001C243ADF|nr:hypothetical protein [Aquihabitans sp. G128]QXC59949.1 hypothetical protein KSP35_16450 [Aquihabitans sp. G128]